MLQQTTPAMYNFTINGIDGTPVSLDQYQGKVVLFVNVASECGYTRQYSGLQALFQKYSGDGLIIAGLPANNFGGQEPGSDEKILEFCTTRFSVSFPMFSKMSAKGSDQSDFFRFLSNEPNPDFTGPISWNFEKFLFNREGKLVRRFKSSADPLDGELEKAVLAELAVNPSK